MYQHSMITVWHDKHGRVWALVSYPDRQYVDVHPCAEGVMSATPVKTYDVVNSDALLTMQIIADSGELDITPQDVTLN